MAKEVTLTPEEIEKNYNKFLKILDNTGDRSGPLKELVEFFGERFALAPASTRVAYHACYPGGLVDHSIRVLSFALKLRTAFSLEEKISKESVIVAALFHDLGKVGDETNDYYVEQPSDWHREKLGELYKTNESLTFMPHCHRSIWLLQQFGVKLTQDEFLAIMTHDGQYINENKSYAQKEVPLAIILHMADYLATKAEKGVL